MITTVITITHFPTITTVALARDSPVALSAVGPLLINPLPDELLHVDPQLLLRLLCYRGFLGLLRLSAPAKQHGYILGAALLRGVGGCTGVGIRVDVVLVMQAILVTRFLIFVSPLSSSEA